MNATAEKSSARLLFAALRQTLIEASQQGATLLSVEWQSGDSDGAYLLHVDGRVLPVGDYQENLSNIHDLDHRLASPEASSPGTDSGLSMRATLGLLAGFATIPKSDEDWQAVAARAMEVFSEEEAEIVGGVGPDPRAFALRAFDLLTTASPQRPVNMGYVTGLAEATRDIHAAVLVKDASGNPAWESRVVARKGDTVECDSASALDQRCAVAVPGTRTRVFVEPSALADFRTNPKVCKHRRPSP